MAKKAVTRRAPAKEESSNIAVEETPSPPTSPERNGQVAPVEETEPKRWKMPQPCRGQVVIFYSKGTKSERNVDIGFVVSVGEKNIDIAYRGIKYSDLLHIDDPRLKENPELRHEIGGAWDFTEEHKELQNRLMLLENEVAAINRVLENS